jgi:hypothetical protein
MHPGRWCGRTHTDNLGVSTTWSDTISLDDFSKNLIRARDEGRYATSVFPPLCAAEPAAPTDTARNIGTLESAHATVRLSA